MSETDVMAQLEGVFHRVFFDDAIELRREHTALDIDGWDSLTHVRLIMAIEKQFSISLPAAEVVELSTVGELADIVGAKLAA